MYISVCMCACNYIPMHTSDFGTKVFSHLIWIHWSDTSEDSWEHWPAIAKLIVSIDEDILLDSTKNT